MSDHDPLCSGSDYYCVCDLIRQAEQRGREAGYASRMDEAEQDFTVGHDKGYWRGQRDAIRDAVSRVEALFALTNFASNERVIAAIKGEQ
jgi:hypothetical protein